LPLAAAVFDLDGTLLDSLPLTFTAFRAALRPHLKRDVSDQEIYARFGPADHLIVADWAGPEVAPDAVRRLMEVYEEGAGWIHPYPGVMEMLEALRRAGLSLALCTGRGRPSTELLLARTGLAAWFPVVVTGEEVPRPKPATDGILETARRLGLQPAQVLYAGDSVKDVEAGLSAGSFTVAALWAGTEPDGPGFRAAHARARHPLEIVELARTRG
jgi:HAD superfamily hydrolase (TIGR01509 family)